MKIKRQIVAQAWHTLTKQTPNKFWGFIVVLQNIHVNKNDFKSGEVYKIDIRGLSEDLTNLFYFGSLAKSYSDQAYYITLSNFWMDKSSEFLLNHKPNIRDVVIFYYHNSIFLESLNLSGLVEKFKNSLPLADQQLEKFVDLNFTDEEITLEEDYRKDLLIGDIEALIGRTLDNKTISFESPFSIQAHPSELTRANFFQTLYSSQGGLDSFLITKFDLQEFYPTLVKSIRIAIDSTIPLNVIYYGPPGTGKTRKLQNLYLDGKTKDEKEFITFHQSYSYEEFIEGIKPGIGLESDLNEKISTLTYHYADGVFLSACEKAAKLAGFKSLQDCIDAKYESRTDAMVTAINTGKIFTFCIDEINRANIAGVFGDLITMIEPGKRLGAEEELTVALPYSKRVFGVPANLRIIGSMNTADRSITVMDSALRRRFSFEEVSPQPDALSSIIIDTINLPNLLNVINNRITYFLGKDLNIGHAYFLTLNSIENPSKADLLRIFINKIIPLLEEYFYNDSEKIRLVLGDNKKSEEDWPFYVVDRELDARKLFDSSSEELIEKTYYTINPTVIDSLSDGSAEIPESCFTLIY